MIEEPADRVGGSHVMVPVALVSQKALGQRIDLKSFNA